MFCDEVIVHFIAGKGGEGCVAFRREKFVPRGGPSGGDGGVGGSVILRADENINTLAEFNMRKTFRANSGERGGGSQKAGKDAQDLILPVPVGTMIFDEGKKQLLGDLQSHGESFVVGHGGRGGFGNAHFKTSTRQAPNFAELGEPGEERTCTLELKLVADVGIIGLPSVGKSTLLSRISNARPKIAEYPFTTIIPNLGLVTMKQFGGSLQQSFLACDLPGLIEGASAGKGLGIQFLKHVARNRVLVHLLDVTSVDPSGDYKTIVAELKKFDKTLPKKPTLVAFNKIDAVSPAAVGEVTKNFKKKHRTIKNIYAISCVTGEGIKELMFAVWEGVKKSHEAEVKTQPAATDADFKIFRPAEEKNDRAFSVKRMKSNGKTRIFQVTGRRIQQIVVMTDFQNEEAVARVYDVFEKMHIHKELRRAGARFGDEIQIAGATIIYRWE